MLSLRVRNFRQIKLTLVQVKMIVAISLEEQIAAGVDKFPGDDKELQDKLSH